MKKKKGNNNIVIIIVIIVLIITLFCYLTFSNKKNEYKITLTGDKYITLTIGEVYIEPGYMGFINNELATDQVKVTNEIKPVPGLYRILYQIGDIYEYRYIEVKEKVDPNLEINLDGNTSLITNKDVVIGITVSGETFYSLTLPNNEIVYSSVASYTVSENGVYKFEARNLDNELFVKEISITNIDKEKPTGSCTATLNQNNTEIVVTTNEDNLNYQYYDNNKLLTSSNNNKYTSGKTTDKITVIIEDEATNQNQLTCKIIDKRYYEQVRPSSNDKIVYHGESETFKTYIVNRGSYYLSYFWVKNAYSQLNKFDSPEYGSKLYAPKVLLTNAKDKYNLNNKIIVGFNASGFYLRDTFDASSVNAYGKYDKTSVGTLVITNGVVVRNAYNYAVKTWYTVGVNKNNKLLVFEDKKSTDSNEKKAWSETVINSGIRNTFTFSAPLIENGQRTNITTSMPGGFNDKKGLQIICQINDNNFLLFTSQNEARNTAINEFLKLGCKTAMNLDGGGSVALFYKDKNSNDFTRVIGGGRSLPEVGYFTE
jgi:hypothetical protein